MPTLSNFDVYNMSKAGCSAYTMITAKAHPNIMVSCVDPGFVVTNMTKGIGFKLTREYMHKNVLLKPEQGSLSTRHCLFQQLKGNGWFYGPDGLRSPLDKDREAGELEYQGN